MPTVNGTADNDVIHVAGDGVLVPAGFNDIPQATNGADHVFAAAGDDLVAGGGGDDRLDGGAGADTLSGGAGNDVLVPGGGIDPDALSGGSGVDTVDYSGADGQVFSTIGGTGGGSDRDDKVGADIENLIGTGFSDALTGAGGANRLDGGASVDFLRGLGGNDQLIGGAGDDILLGGAGADHLEGGAGADAASYQDSNVAVTVNLAARTASGGEALGDSLVSIENLGGSRAGDALTGSSGANLIGGFGGADIIAGLGGDDILAGGAGDDLLRGGSGADALVGGDDFDADSGIDTASYSDSPAAVAVALGTASAPGTGSGGDALGDRLFGIESLNGSAFGDRLTGAAGANRLQGLAGNDILAGGAGADMLNGGAGTDLATYFGATAGVTVDLLQGGGRDGDAEGDSYVSIENVNGGRGGDVIVGDAGANALNGFEGNDLLQGGTGRDTLTGGAGADRFVYAAIAESAVGANADRITDFSHGQGDRVDLSAIDADPALAGNQAFRFIGTGLYTHQAGELRFAATAPGVTTIAGDVDGDGASDVHIRLTGTAALAAADFVL